MSALEYALLAVQAIGALVRAGQEVHGLIEETGRVLGACKAETRDPLAAEWDALNGVIGRLQGVLHAGEPSPTEGGGLAG